MYDADNDTIRADIDRYVNGYRAERNREILKRRLIDGVRFEELAEEFNLSVRHTKTIVYKASTQLFNHVSY